MKIRLNVEPNNPADIQRPPRINQCKSEFELVEEMTFPIWASWVHGRDTSWHREGSSNTNYLPRGGGDT